MSAPGIAGCIEVHEQAADDSKHDGRQLGSAETAHAFLEWLRDCDSEIQREATDKTARQSLAVLGQPVQSAAWQHVPSTYLVCAEDQGTTAELQREFAGRAGSVVELDAGHHPFLSQPAAVCDLILAL